MTPELLAALKVLISENLGDWIYEVRERVLSDESFDGNTWDHPRVKAYSDAVMVVEKAVTEVEANGSVS